MSNKPFDLQKALAGEPVMTEGDTGYYQFTLAKNSRSDDHRHVFKMTAHEDLELHEYVIISDDFGDVISGYNGQDFDKLTMAAVKKTVWVNMWKDHATGLIRCSDKALGTEQAAKEHWTTTMHGFIGTYPIEIEL